MSTTPVDYDRAARSYAAHRRLHAGVLRTVCERGQLAGGSRVLEVGCGTGNYITAVVGLIHCLGHGLDPSAGMLARARSGHPAEPAGWLQGRAERLGFRSGAFDLVFSVDVIHHVADRPAFFVEAGRTLRPGGRVCTATDSEEIIRRREILSGYFPEMVEVELARYPRVEEIEAAMAAAGLEPLERITVEEPYEIISAQPFRDKAFSSLHLISESAWLAGLDRLERDLVRGPVHGTSRYACLWGRKLEG